MIRRLQRKLILAAMASLLAVLTIILTVINALNYHEIVVQADGVLAVLAENGGTFPEADFWEQKKAFMNGETSFITRYFYVVLTGGGETVSVCTEKTATVDEETAVQYGREILRESRKQGFFRNFRFIRRENGNENLLIFLDCTKELSTFRTFLLTGLSVSLAGLAAVLILLLFLSKRIIKPVSESYEKQKRFISDAGHELKTPLTIISADADVLELELGKNEWLQDIQTQSKRMAKLTQDLIYLSKLEEEQHRLEIRVFSLSDETEKAVRSFQTLAHTHGKVIRACIKPNIRIQGDPETITQLISILLDNAVKYAKPEEPILLTLEQTDHAARLQVSNATSTVSQEDLPRLFDRFYRTDPSRNSQTGGHGLGLSIASAIVASHRGEISASNKGGRLTITVTLPRSLRTHHTDKR